MNNYNKYKNAFRILKGGKISLVVSAIVVGTTISYAAPSGGVVTSGNATISQSGKITNINQSTNKASINWNKFNIASDETVNFNQPNVKSITLNRVIGNETSVINGALNANGQVWILNSNGVLFGKNASINTSGLLATTKNLSDENFQSGNYIFSGDSKASIVNTGTINIKNGGYVVFASNETRNAGNIKAVRGDVHLVGADKYTINLNGNSLVNLKVNKGVLDALVENSGIIIADGGSIYLTTNAVDELIKGVVNNSGVLEANSLDELNGHVELFAHGGEVQVGGNISAKDGFVETSGKDFTILDDAKITAGEWLIDPVNITIDNAAAYEYALNNGTDTLIQTDNATGSDEGNIYVNETIAWNTGAKLTLDAYNDIFINADIDVNGAGTLGLYYGQGAVNAGNTSDYHINAPVNLSSSSSFITKQGSDGSDVNWTIVKDITTLQNIAVNGNYVLGSDIDASSTTSWNYDSGNGEYYGFNPIGNFSGNFDGLGHTINNLYINSIINQYYVEKNIGLFSSVNSEATISNIGLNNVDINSTILSNTTSTRLGAIAGRNNGEIKNSFTNGSISISIIEGSNIVSTDIGGFIGTNGGKIKDSYSNTNINTYINSNGNNQELTLGGFIGINFSDVSNSYSAGNIDLNIENGAYIQAYIIGGFIGKNSAAISNSYTKTSSSISTPNISNNIGGFFGRNDTMMIPIVSIGSDNIFFDKTINPSMIDEADYGKTSSELQSIINNSLGWDMEYFSGTENPTLSWQHPNSATTTTWVMGTPPTIIEPEAYLPPVSTPTQSSQERVNKIITPIQNQTAVLKETLSNNIINPTALRAKLVVPEQNESNITAVQTNENTRIVTLSQLRESNDGNSVRVPLNNNSSIVLVDSGVNLPEGIDQEFYVADENK